MHLGDLSQDRIRTRVTDLKLSIIPTVSYACFFFHDFSEQNKLYIDEIEPIYSYDSGEEKCYKIFWHLTAVLSMFQIKCKITTKTKKQFAPWFLNKGPLLTVLKLFFSK